MKRVLSIVAAAGALILLLFLWIKTPDWIYALSARVALASPEGCSQINSRECADFFARMGSTGDTFGATSSLVSSLALFLVALTLWLDGRARREVRKPLLISTFGAESIRLDDPKIGVDGHSSIELFMSLALSNRAPDAALNVTVCAYLRLGEQVSRLVAIDVGMPIAGAEKQSLESKTRLERDLLQELLTDLTGPTPRATVEVETLYTNLEGARWRTRVSYAFERINSIDRQRLNSVRGDQAQVEALWAGNAAVELVPVLQAGSWKHLRA